MDKINGIAATALGGIQSALRRLDAAAEKIAAAPVRRAEPAELVDPLVEALEAQRALDASAAVVRRTDEMLGSLLDALR